MITKIYFLVSLFISCTVLAEVSVDGMVSECSPYPVLKSNLPVPLKFKTTNNLSIADKSGFYDAEGKKITIYGRIMDSNCVPIGDAKIYIWQVNKAGYVQYNSDGASKPKWMDPNFNGTGITNSDNMGRFNFVTIMPGSLHKNTAFINVKVEHPKLKTLYSKIYFPKVLGEKIRGDNVPGKDNALKASAIPAVDELNTYYIDITMHQDVPYKEY
jgi:protocatechuate 3,4-dioxygenase, beta subunit